VALYTNMGHANGWHVIGRVAGLYRHPIKSMAAQSLASATVGAAKHSAAPLRIPHPAR